MRRRNNQWVDRLQTVYKDFSSFLHYATIYGLAERLGYEDALDAWTANPIVTGSVNPAAYRALSHPTPKTQVLFRVWKNNPQSVIAIFPEHPGTNDPNTCSSYEHVGQHGTCQPSGLLSVTRKAKPTEYKDLAKELKRRGYTLAPIKRLRPSNLTTRRSLIEYAR